MPQSTPLFLSHLGCNRGKCLVLVMLGAIQKKIFTWHTGFWGKSGTNGWSYDTMLVVMNLVIVTTGGGNLTLTHLIK